MSCCLLHLHNISWGKIGSRNLLLAISWKSVGDSLCVIGCFGSLPLLGTTLLMRRYLVVDVGWCVGLRKIRSRRCRWVCVVLPFLLEEKESTSLTLTSVINTPVSLASYCWKPLETSCFSCPVVGGPIYFCYTKFIFNTKVYFYLIQFIFLETHNIEKNIFL